MVAAEAAVQQNPRSKEAATLLGYVYIGLVGFEPMQVIKKMSKSQDSSGEETYSQEGAENKDSPAESNGGEKGAATGGLDKVKDIISVTEEDLLKLGEVDDSDPELPIIEPFCANKARQQLRTLQYMDRAISTICPFISESLIATDPRHQCPPNSLQQVPSGKTSLLWSIIHLVETLHFYSVVTFSTQEDRSKSNLEARSEKIKSVKATTPAEISAFIAQVASLNKVIAKTIPQETNCSEEDPISQMNALVNDINAMNLAFAAMPGIPPGTTDGLTKSLEKITSLNNNTDSNEPSQNQGIAALKGDFTARMTDTLKQKIETTDTSKMTKEQQQRFCDSYAAISGGTASKDKLPALCQ